MSCPPSCKYLKVTGSSEFFVQNPIVVLWERRSFFHLFFLHWLSLTLSLLPSLSTLFATPTPLHYPFKICTVFVSIGFPNESVCWQIITERKHDKMLVRWKREGNFAINYQLCEKGVVGRRFWPPVLPPPSSTPSYGSMPSYSYEDHINVN